MGRERLMSALLKFINFSTLHTWSPHLLLSNGLTYKDKYRIVFFKEFTEKANIEKINIQDNEKYKILGVRSYGKGVYLNREVLGSSLKMKKYQKGKKNHLYWCKVDTKNGAFGIIPESLEDGIGSSNMTFAKLDTSKIYPPYLELFFKSKKFNQYMDSLVVGTTNRKYIKFNDLLNDVKIPLPSLAKQKEIVDAYQSKIALAEKQEQEAKEKEKEIEAYLYRELGIEILSNASEKLFNFANFKNIGRWDTLFLLDENKIKSNYELIPISKITNTFLKDLNNHTLRIDTKKYPNDTFRYIGMEHMEKESGKLLKLEEVKGIDIKSQTIKLPKGFFLYGKLRPYLNKYYFNELGYDNIIVSSEFFVFSVQNIDEEYFRYVLASSFIQFQIENHMKGARMPRISEGTFKNLKIPLPDIKLQVKIANYISNLKAEIKELKKQAKENKTLALQEFEKEIFNEA